MHEAESKLTPEAPLDYEVDPWGCKKLREHLNRHGTSVLAAFFWQILKGIR